MLTLRCFGGVSVRDDAGTELVLRSRKHLGLFLYLVAHRRTIHAREDLAELLWSGSGARERHSLSQALYDIRTTLGAVTDVATRTVRIEEGAVSCEAERFERAVESGDHRLALDLYRGDFAPNLMNLGIEPFDRWMDGESERYRVLASLALRNAQRAAEERGDWDGMCLAALRLIRVNEFDEEAHCALMRGLWMKGDPASALRHHRSLASRGYARHWTAANELVDRLERSGIANEVLAMPRRPIELVGRGRQFEALFALLEKRATTGGVVAISGERGVGKTAFLVEFARLAEVRGRSVSWATRWGGDPRDVEHGGAAGPGARPAVVVVDRNEPPPLETAHDARYRRPLTVIASAREGTRGGAAEIRLDRLTRPRTVRLVSRRFPGISAEAAAAAAELSGGNPALAIELSYAFEGHGWPDERGSARDAGNSALAHSSSLRAVVDAFLDDLSREEHDVARTLALLTPPARAVAVRLFDSPSAREGLAALRQRGWLVDDGEALRLAHPILAIALRQRSGFAERRQVHESAAGMLSDGGPEERYAAAAELAAAGKTDVAYEMATGAAREALANGDSAVAAASANAARSYAPRVVERLRSTLLAAETELAVGRHLAAQDFALAARDTVGSPEELLETQELLIRSLIAGGEFDQCRSELAQLSGDERTAGLPRATSIQRLLGAHVELASSLEAPDAGQAHKSARRLEDWLERELRSEERTAIALDTLRLLFYYKASHVSLESGAALLARVGPQLAAARGPAADFLDLSRAFIEVRSGRLRSGAKVLTRLLAAEARTADRGTAAALNNLAVVYMELGEFVRARELLERNNEVDRVLATATRDRRTTLTNQAQLAWFDSRPAESRCLCEAELDSEISRSTEMTAEVLALLGLMAIEARESHVAQAIAEKLEEVPTFKLGRQDQYLLSWFNAAFTASVVCADPTEELLSAARRLDPVDALGAAKLRVVCVGLSGDRSRREDAHALRLLRSAGSGWFVRRFGSSS